MILPGDVQRAIAEIERAAAADGLSAAERERLAALVGPIAPLSARAMREERNDLIRAYRAQFLPGLSARAAARRIITDFERFAAGEGRALTHRVTPPPGDERRRLLWRLMKAGPLPGFTAIREIIG